MKKELLVLTILALASSGCTESYYRTTPNRPTRRTITTTPRRYTPSPAPRRSFNNPTAPSYRSRTPQYAPSRHGSPGRTPGFNPRDSKYTPQDRTKMRNYQKNREFEANKARMQQHFRNQGHKFTPKTTHRR